MFRCLALLVVLGACGRGGDTKPTGTTNDPVEVCERIADVCRINQAKLGVCMQRADGAGFICTSQH